MQAVLLVGGQGTRLRSVVGDRPKALAPVAGRPFLEYPIARLRAFGIREIVLCVGYLAEQIEAHFGTGEGFGVQLTYQREETPLGTGGALKRAEALIRDTALVLNGDTYFDLDLPALIRSHEQHAQKSSPCLATLALLPAEAERRYGCVALDGEGRITRFSEKSSDDPAPWISAGVYVLEREKLLARIPPGQPVSLEREVFPGVLEAGGGLWGFPAEGFFIDIGTPEGYQLLERHVRNSMRA
jgi:NDP-sugar pyrophosphorylase family protein